MVREVHRDLGWTLAGVIPVIVLLGALAGLRGVGSLVALGATTGLVVFLRGGLVHSGATRLGPANRVTLARAILVCAIAGLVAQSYAAPVPTAWLAGLASLALLLDGVDGRVARRTGTVTALGARFDMEVDAVLILVLSVYAAGLAWPFVLLIGAARYLFVAAGWVWPWLRGVAPARYWCKVVAVIQGVVLVGAAAEVLPRPIMTALLLVAGALLAESFGRDVWRLWQARSAGALATVRAGELARV